MISRRFEDGKQIQYSLFIPTLPVQRTHEVELGPIAGLWIILGLTGAQMRSGNQGEGIGIHFK